MKSSGELRARQVAFLTFLSKNGVRVTNYAFLEDGSLEIVYKKRLKLYEPAFFIMMPKWDTKVKKLVLDSVRYGSADAAEKVRKERRKKREEKR